MPDSGSSHGSSLPNVDVSTITDPDIRRAFRMMVQQNQHLTARMHQQQQEIEALLQMILEKHVGSVSEFKRHMLRLQSGDARSERLHGMITGGAPNGTTNGTTNGTAAAAAPAKPRRPEPEIAEPEIDRPRRYTL
jgi:hypothetical protein